VDTPPTAEVPDSTAPAWIEAASYTTVEEARLAQGLLLERGIPSEVLDRHLVQFPLPQVDEAEVLLLVPPELGERADVVLAEAEAGVTALAAEVELEPPDSEEPEP
jgi:hypothetical protein